MSESMFPQPNQRNQFRSTKTEDQNPLLPVKLKPVDMQKGAGSRPFLKPLMVKPNFTVNSLETRFNPPVFSNGPNGVSRRDAVGATPPNREQQENSYAETPSSGAWTPIKPSVVQKHVFHKDISAGPKTIEDLTVPKIKSLPSVFALGKCPAKPKRPPHVNLNKFRGNAGSLVSNTSDPEFDPGIFPLPPPPDECLSITSMTPPPPPPECLSITSMTPPTPPDFTLPPPMDQTFQEDLYDDTDTINRTPTSLGKSSNAHEESGEEIYEDLDHNQPEDNKETTTKESKELKKKLEKEEKKRLEQEKKEKKEREKRQQEAKKKFKIKDVTAVVDTVKARVDHKGGKNKLPLKQGETIEIVRKTENPKDYWLARNTEGHYGFVKPDTLDVRGEVRHTQDGQEVYDDVGAADELNNLPDAVECDDDIYAECEEDAQADLSFLPPPPPADFEFNVLADGVYDDTYDDVTASDFPPPPSPCSNRKFSSTSETNMMDSKKKKKFEKEEKEFRKKFKYNAEIRVLYQATVLQSLSMKKFGNKDLPIKPGEMIDVIVHPVDGKLICRNSEGKFGNVSTANLEQDGSVYDDVGNECIYDND